MEHKQPEWHDSPEQQDQMREGVISFATKARNELEGCIGDHGRLDEKIFTEEELATLLAARNILSGLSSK